MAHQVIYEETVGHGAGETKVYQENSLVRGRQPRLKLPAVSDVRCFNVFLQPNIGGALGLW